MYYLYEPSDPIYVIQPDVSYPRYQHHSLHPALEAQVRRQQAIEEAAVRQRAYEEALYRRALEEELQRRAFEEEMERRRAVELELRRRRELERQRAIQEEIERRRELEREFLRREWEKEMIKRQREEEERREICKAILEEGLRRERERELWRKTQQLARQQLRQKQPEKEQMLRENAQELERAAPLEQHKTVRTIPITFIDRRESQPITVTTSTKPASVRTPQVANVAPAQVEVSRIAQAEAAPAAHLKADTTSTERKTIPIQTPAPISKDPITAFTRSHAARTLQNHFRHRRPKLTTLHNILKDVRTAITNLEQPALQTPVQLTSSGTFLPHHNKPFVAYEEALLSLLVRADAVQSDGSRCVRERRKSVVKEINSRMEALDAVRKEALRKWDAEHQVAEATVDDNVEQHDKIEVVESIQENKGEVQPMQLDKEIDGATEQNEQVALKQQSKEEADSMQLDKGIEGAAEPSGQDSLDVPAAAESAMQVDQQEPSESRETTETNVAQKEDDVQAPVQPMNIDGQAPAPVEPMQIDEPQQQAELNTAPQDDSTPSESLQTTSPDPMQIDFDPSPQQPSTIPTPALDSQQQEPSIPIPMQIDYTSDDQIPQDQSPQSQSPTDWTHLSSPSEEFVVVEREQPTANECVVKG